MYITITSHVFSYRQINLQTFITSSILSCPCFIAEYITFIWLPTNLTSNFHRFQHTHLYTYLGSSYFWVHDKYIADNKSTFKLSSLPAYLARVPSSRPYYVHICLCVYLPACVRDGHRTTYLLTHVPTYLCDVHRTTSPMTSTRSWWAGNPCRTRCAARTPSSLRWTAPTWPWSCPHPRRRERNWRSATPSSTLMAPWQSLRSELAPAVVRQSLLECFLDKNGMCVHLWYRYGYIIWGMLMQWLMHEKGARKAIIVSSLR